MAKSCYEKVTKTAQEENYSFFSVLFFQWMSIILKTGNERAIEKDDLLPLKEENTTSFLSEKLQSSWNQETDSGKRYCKGPKLWKSVLKMISVKEAIIITLTGSLRTFSNILQPLLLGYLLESLRNAEQKHNYFVYICALGIGINELFAALNVHHFSFQCEMLGIKISGALKGLVYNKTLLLSKDSLLRFSTGHVIDLVSNDVQRLEADTVRLFLVMPFSILQLVVISYLLVHFIGWQTSMGITFLCLLLPYLGGLSSAGATIRSRTAAVSDRRISLINQVISGIRAIKSYAWEKEYKQKIGNIRRNEISFILKKSAVLSAIAALEYTSTPMATMLTIITLSLTGHPLTPANVFILLSFINLLRQNFCINVAYGLLQSYDAYVSLRRIQDFLLLDNLTSTTITRKRLEDNENWQGPHKSAKLEQDIVLLVESSMLQEKDKDDGFGSQNVATKKGSLIVITGPVGSGKSTLLSTIAGEGTTKNISITCRGSTIYVPQTPWLFSGTVRDNILFGEPYEESKYARIIEACALADDIQQFPDGDKAVVGERGAALSGGQRARVSLARAAYADADLYLLDDPLSALDPKVGLHIFTKCIKGLLGQKTRLIASHHQQLMREADEVIVLYKGEILDKGPFDDLKAKGLLNTTVDPPYKKATDSDESFGEQGEEKDEISDTSNRKNLNTNECKTLRLSEEDRAIGVVSTRLYWNFFRSGAPLPVIIAGVCFCLIAQVMLVSPDVWLSLLTRKQSEYKRDKKNLTIYGLLVGAAFIFLVIRAFGFYLVCVRCSERLHDRMVEAVLHAPVFFFDSNPVGRIMNRFSKDVGSMDEVLPKTFLRSIQLILLLLMTILVPTVTNPWILLVVTPIAVLAGLWSRYYLKTSRELQRLESICRSPVYSRISETLDGLDTIRTRKKEGDFVSRFHRCQDVHTKSFIVLLASGRWLGVRLDIFSSLLTGAVALAAVLVSEDPALVGLSLVYVVQTVNLTQFAVRQLTEVENLMTAVERVITYTELDPEPGYKVKQLPPENWPDKGSVTFQDVSMTYHPGGPQVLRNISLSIKAGAKIGVVGRTGSGKSSFAAALMRMPEAEGDILIDDVLLRNINLKESRRAITVLGQNPALFSGSLRKNLDVIEQFQDAELWQALEQVQVKHLVENLEGQLDYELLENGANLSIGERQLICLARVLLHQKKIVILDEPTAHVDPDTERTIWNVVHEKLSDSTVITVAHRLNTITNCDKILVLDSGEVSGFDSFQVLCNRPGNKLHEMAQKTEAPK